MLFPTLDFEKVTDIQPEKLDALKIDVLLLDVDNTLSYHGAPEPAEGVSDWIYQMQSAGKKLIIISNNSAQRVEPFAQKLGLDFVSRSLKPLSRGFRIALRKLKMKKSQAAVVGDQIFTDILGGNLFGVKTILLKPILPENGWFFRLKRRAERYVLKKYRKRKG